MFEDSNVWEAYKNSWFFCVEWVWCSIFGKRRISTILLNTIPAGIPVGGHEPLQAQEKQTQNAILPATSWELETWNQEPPSHSSMAPVWSLP